MLDRAGEINLEKLEEGKTTLYPNPTSGKVILDIFNRQISAQDLSLFDVSGRSYGIKRVRRLSGNRLELDLSGFTPGTYFVRVKADNGFKTLPVVKQ